MRASANGNIDVVKILLKQKNIDINEKNNGYNAFLLAAENGQKDVLELLIEKGVDINSKDNRGETALMKASEKGCVEIVKFLLEQKGIDIKNLLKDSTYFSNSIQSHRNI